MLDWFFVTDAVLAAAILAVHVRARRREMPHLLSVTVLLCALPAGSGFVGALGAMLLRTHVPAHPWTLHKIEFLYEPLSLIMAGTLSSSILWAFGAVAVALNWLSPGRP